MTGETDTGVKEVVRAGDIDTLGSHRTIYVDPETGKHYLCIDWPLEEEYYGVMDIDHDFDDLREKYGSPCIIATVSGSKHDPRVFQEVTLNRSKHDPRVFQEVTLNQMMQWTTNNQQRILEIFGEEGR